MRDISTCSKKSFKYISDHPEKQHKPMIMVGVALIKLLTGPRAMELIPPSLALTLSYILVSRQSTHRF